MFCIEAVYDMTETKDAHAFNHTLFHTYVTDTLYESANASVYRSYWLTLLWLTCYEIDSIPLNARCTNMW